MAEASGQTNKPTTFGSAFMFSTTLTKLSFPEPPGQPPVLQDYFPFPGINCPVKREVVPTIGSLYNGCNPETLTEGIFKN
jgi:hypothetical protein